MEKERIALGVKQLEKDPFSEAVKDNIKIGKVVTCHRKRFGYRFRSIS